MHILWLDVQVLVLSHQLVTLAPKPAAILCEVAAELDEIENIDLLASVQPNEVVHEFSHFSLFSLSLVAFAPLSTRHILKVRHKLLLWPEFVEPFEELEEVDYVSERGVI